MPIVSMKDLLYKAQQEHYCVGYFEAWDQYSLEAVLEAAEETRSPTLLGFGAAVANQEWMDHWGVEELTGLAHCLAQQAKVPAAVLFNEARTSAQLLRGIRAGCNAVMLDTSDLPYDQNLAETRQIVEIAHALGVDVEAELGHLPDAQQGSSEGGRKTDVTQAVRFVKETGIDALAVSIGNVHAQVNGQVNVDLELLETLHRAVSIPLVLHGGSSFPNAEIHAVVKRGVAKLNYGTKMKHVFLEGVREGLNIIPSNPNIHDYIGSKGSNDILIKGKEKIKLLVIQLMKLYGTAGKA
jgi:ketose-bisphosphate aldolase